MMDGILKKMMENLTHEELKQCILRVSDRQPDATKGLKTDMQQFCIMFLMILIYNTKLKGGENK